MLPPAADLYPPALTDQVRTGWGNSVAKAGLEPGENEDAFSFDPHGNWLAIADGATEASYSRLWAQELVRGFAAACRCCNLGDLDKEFFATRIALVQARWRRRVPWKRLAARGWMFEDKARQGAFATFLGLIFQRSRWWTLGIGDCNLFIVGPDGHMRLSAPAQHFSDFGMRPLLVPSVPGRALDKALANVWECGGALNEGEHLVAATDAVAAHLLLSPDNAVDLLTRQDANEFAMWVDKARDEGMRNDDATAIVIHCGVQSATRNPADASPL